MVVSSSHNPIDTSKAIGAFFQSKKRKYISEEETSQYNGDGLFEELEEERRLRLLAEQENHQLRQKLENYEGRMQKYEERLDIMMPLLKAYKEEK